MAQKWMQKVRESMERKGTVGALRRTAQRMGLIKGDEPLSQSDLAALERRAEETGNTTLKRRVNLARVFKRVAARRARESVHGTVVDYTVEGASKSQLHGKKKGRPKRAEEGAVVQPPPPSASPLPSGYEMLRDAFKK